MLASIRQRFLVPRFTSIRHMTMKCSAGMLSSNLAQREDLMRIRLLLKIIAILVLACAGVFLYAEMVFVHPIYRVTDSMVQSAVGAQTRQRLLDRRNRQNREEHTLKMEIGVGLVLDVAMLLVLSGSLFRKPRAMQSS
jgi:hypothetical protein